MSHLDVALCHLNEQNLNTPDSLTFKEFPLSLMLYSQTNETQKVPQTLLKLTKNNKL